MLKSSIRIAVVLVLGLMLAMPPGFCLDCCCSEPPAAPERSDGHACCAKADVAPNAPRLASSAGCECPELAGESAETPRVLTTPSTVEADDSNGPMVALELATWRSSHPIASFGSNPAQPPPFDSTPPQTSLAPRAPPAVS